MVTFLQKKKDEISDKQNQVQQTINLPCVSI